jgi:NAD(P)H dehydrogenase (quinone)
MEQANMLLGMFHASRRGEFATTGSTLENLLGRAAMPVRPILEGATTPR